MQADPLVDIAYAESMGNVQIHIFISEVCVEFVGICSPAGIGYPDAEHVRFFPRAQKDGNACVLARDAVADRILHERLKGKFGDKDLCVRAVRRDFQMDLLAETQRVDRDILPYIFHLCVNADKLVRLCDAVTHQVGDGINRSGDIILFAHQCHVVYGVHCV